MRITMLSRICFVSLCVFAVQLHGAEQEVVSRELGCRPYGDIKKTYEEWTKGTLTAVWPETMEGNGKGPIIPGKYTGKRVRERDGRVEYLSSEQAKTLFLKFEKEYEAQVQARTKKGLVAVIAGATLLYVSVPDCVKEFGSDILKLVTQTFF